MVLNSLISINQLSDAIRVPKATIYAWTAQNRIPHYKIGRHLRFDLEEVLEHFKTTSNTGITMAPQKLKQDSLTTESLTNSMRKRMEL